MRTARIKTFKDLLVWQKAMQLCIEVYRVTRTFRPDEKHGLTAEARKTARSIPYNIAEGYKRGSTVEYIRFLGIAGGSISELETQLLLADSLGYDKDRAMLPVLALRAEVERMLDSLVRALKAKIK